MSRSFYVWTENILDEKAWSSAVFVDEPGIDPDVSLSHLIPTPLSIMS
jgi:hypothetical protein